MKRAKIKNFFIAKYSKRDSADLEPNPNSSTVTFCIDEVKTEEKNKLQF